MLTPKQHVCGRDQRVDTDPACCVKFSCLSVNYSKINGGDIGLYHSVHSQLLIMFDW